MTVRPLRTRDVVDPSRCSASEDGANLCGVLGRQPEVAGRTVDPQNTAPGSAVRLVPMRGVLAVADDVCYSL